MRSSPGINRRHGIGGEKMFGEAGAVNAAWSVCVNVAQRAASIVHLAFPELWHAMLTRRQPAT
jgi:hypothetical protein